MRGAESRAVHCVGVENRKSTKTGANGRRFSRGKRGSDGASAAAPRVRESRGLSSFPGADPRRPDKISGDAPVQADRRPTGAGQGAVTPIRYPIGHIRLKVAPVTLRMSLFGACATEKWEKRTTDTRREMNDEDKNRTKMGPRNLVGLDQRLTIR